MEHFQLRHDRVPQAARQRCTNSRTIRRQETTINYDVPTEMAAHPRYASLDEAARFALVGRASIVLHGLGLELWSGRLVAADRTARLDLIDQLVGPAVDAAIAHAWTTDFHSRRDPSSGARRTA